MKPFQLSLLDREAGPKGVPAKLLPRLLTLDDETGELRWTVRSEDLFSDGYWSASIVCARWNNRHAGNLALTAMDTHGYRHGHVMGRLFLAHKVVWALHYGDWPSGQIDHINGVRLDNRISNLRVVSARDNARNCSIRHDNKSGVTGVGYHSRLGKWYANIGVNGRLHHIGYFADMPAAVLARKEAERREGFHENHGRAA